MMNGKNSMSKKRKIKDEKINYYVPYSFFLFLLFYPSALSFYTEKCRERVKTDKNDWQEIRKITEVGGSDEVLKFLLHLIRFMCGHKRNAIRELSNFLSNFTKRESEGGGDSHKLSDFCLRK